MKSLVIATLMCTALLIANAWLLALPVKAADCTARCSNGGIVWCSGYRCSAQDGVGCAAWDSRGRPLIEIPCNSE